MDATTRQRLLEAAIAARENNVQTDFADPQDRRWQVSPVIAANQSFVLIQVRKGDQIRERPLSTSTFTPEAAAAAIDDLNGALQ